MQGTIGLLVFLYPSAHLSHCLRVTPSLHGHWPVVWSQIFPMDPCGWQLHATKNKRTSKVDLALVLLRTVYWLTGMVGV